MTLYAVDPTSTAAGLTEITDISQTDFATAAGGLSDGAIGTFNADAEFDKLGLVTGGRVIRGLNDVDHQIATDIDLGADFYTLAYSPSTPADADPNYRNIRVVCLRPGLTVTTRAGYFTHLTPEEKSPKTLAYDLTTAAESTIPLNGLHVTATADPSAGPQTYIVHVTASGLTWNTQPSGASTASVEVMSASLKQGHLVGHTERAETAHAGKAVDLRNSALNADFTLTIKPVAKSDTLRFIVRDNASGRIGSYDIPLR